MEGTCYRSRERWEHAADDRSANVGSWPHPSDSEILSERQTANTYKIVGASPHSHFFRVSRLTTSGSLPATERGRNMALRTIRGVIFRHALGMTKILPPAKFAERKRSAHFRLADRWRGIVRRQSGLPDSGNARIIIEIIFCQTLRKTCRHFSCSASLRTSSTSACPPHLRSA